MSQIFPDKATFKKLAKTHNLIVLSRKFYCDWLTPLAVYASLSKSFKGEKFLLESLEGEDKICRYSFMGFKAITTFKTKGEDVEITGRFAREFKTKDPLSELKKLMAGFKVAPKENLRFFGGFVGYLGYDLVRFYEPVGAKKPGGMGDYDSYLILPQYLFIFDHVKREIEILSFVHLDDQAKIDALYLKAVDELNAIYAKAITPYKLPVLNFKPKKLNFKSNFSKDGFKAAVEKVKGHIKEGDLIQLVLSQRFRVDFKGDPFTVYRYLRNLNPSPYMLYLDFKDHVVCGASPEMLLRCENSELVTRPIAGSRPRGKSAQEDEVLKNELLKDIKERAEHVMLVDLARNDLGRVAQAGSVNVPIFMDVERFSHIMHIVSEVRARLNDDENIFSAYTRCAPAGTLSGAPKVRAMQIINELEPQGRGIYGGSVGYFSFTNSLDTCIIIRTIVFKDNKAYIQAGAGLVYDSVPETEFQETVNKAKAQLLTLELAAGERDAK